MELRKNPPFHINPEKPFDEDKLEQKSSIELLTRLIQSADQPFVITVEAPWGWGKTKFIERWKAHLATLGHACLYFNAWENDFVSDPLVAFVGELKPLIESLKEGKDQKSPIRKNLSRLQKLGSALAKKGAPIIIKAAGTKLLGSDAVKDVADVLAESGKDIAEAVSEAVKERIEHYQEEKDTIVGFRTTLTELGKQIAAAEGKPKQVVFFVDELDRCRPDFAMTLLERIKHLFTVDNFIFVLALDREQLRNTVRSLYGSGINADAYLRRFIDFSYKLPKPSFNSFAHLLHERFDMAHLFDKRKNGGTELMRLLPAFIDTAKWLDLDLRTQEQCFTRFNAIARLWSAEFLPTDALCVLVGLKVGRPEMFDGLRSGSISLEGIGPKATQEDPEFPMLVETTLEAVFLRADSYESKATKVFAQYRVERMGADRKTDLFVHIAQHRQELMRLIEFSSGLQ